MKKDISLPSLQLNSITTKQINQSVGCLQEIFGQDLLAVYLYGSALVGGLQKYSDIDLFVVLDRPSTNEEKKALVKALLGISGIYMKEPKRSIEMTIVQKSAVNPWCYPPMCDFQYGEWLREDFEKGNIQLSSSLKMSDLAVLITQVLLAHCTLLGFEPQFVLCRVPYKDFITALSGSLPVLTAEVESDTRNVLLTLARIWRTVSTDTICSKQASAQWALERLPEQYHPVMKRARAICIGKHDEYWGDLQKLVEPCVKIMVVEANKSIAQIMVSDCLGRSIKIASV